MKRKKLQPAKNRFTILKIYFWTSIKVYSSPLLKGQNKNRLASKKSGAKIYL